MKHMKNTKNMKTVERLLFLLSGVSMLLFVVGYWVKPLFLGFLLSIAVFFVVWVGFWKCPHCGRRLWLTFDAPCKHCGKNVFEAPEQKPKNTEERRGFFGW